ncbi:hypothetical protein [Roseixanthobacter glucoisosaccharinicivorans]|uniref:hypothetical protein n=1 Tax=Roseixanthobacter glucoisosaccharinicivorans TaxID=3119923 RepID=UPI0037263885
MHALSRHLPHFGPVRANSGTPQARAASVIETMTRPPAPGVGPAAARAAAAPPAASKPSAAAPAREAPHPEPVPRITAEELERAVALARREASAALAAANEAAAQARIQDQAEFDARLAEARAAWAREEGEVLAQHLQKAVGELEHRISDTVAHVLTPFLDTEIRAKAVTDLCALMRTRLAGASGAAVRISAPADLLEAMRVGLGERPGLAFVEEAGPEIRVVADDTLMETQLAAWSERLRPIPA